MPERLETSDLKSVGSESKLRIEVFGELKRHPVVWTMTDGRRDSFPQYLS